MSEQTKFLAEIFRFHVVLNNLLFNPKNQQFINL